MRHNRFRALSVILVAGFLMASCAKAPAEQTSTATGTTETTLAQTTEATTAESTTAQTTAEATTAEPTTAQTTEAQTTTAAPSTEAKEPVYTLVMEADFLNGCPDTFMPSGDWTNGSMFNVTWRQTSCTFEDGKLQLTIDVDPLATDIPYSGAELRSKDFYGYGRYEVSMKAIKNDGVVSSFFTYTGPSDNNPWDEIDIEVLGKDTTKVQFNYFTNGKGNHEKMYDLGFDASEDFHTYAFEWRKDRIDWFVDGELVHTAKRSIPSTEGKIMMNAWCGTGVDSWLKAFDDSNLPLTAEYQWIKFYTIEE